MGRRKVEMGLNLEELKVFRQHSVRGMVDRFLEQQKHSKGKGNKVRRGARGKPSGWWGGGRPKKPMTA